MTDRRILKWTIPVDDHDHPIGIGAVVHVAVQGNHTNLVQVWTDEFDTSGRMTSARVYGTGQPIPEDGEVLGSALVLGGALVWHVVRAGAAVPGWSASEGPVERILALCGEWDALSKGETPTTRRIREALR